MNVSRGDAMGTRRRIEGGSRRRFVSMAAWLLLVLTAACSKSRLQPSAGAMRIVSLSPSTTETLFAIGAANVTVGRSRYCDYPLEAAALPQVGGYVDPNVEAILALTPSLVVGARGPAGPKFADLLAARGIATYFPETESLAQIEEMILGLGERSAHVEGARALVDRIHGELVAVADRVRDKPRVRVLLVFGLDPIVVAGPGTFPDEMLRRAGGQNVVAGGANYPTVSIERILALDPDLVLNAAIAEAHGGERIHAQAAGWSQVRAVKRGRVVALHDESVLRPGPRVVRGIEAIARAIHGE
jgi:iron complex transport system substrate-binding protein